METYLCNLKNSIVDWINKGVDVNPALIRALRLNVNAGMMAGASVSGKRVGNVMEPETIILISPGWPDPGIFFNFLFPIKMQKYLYYYD